MRKMKIAALAVGAILRPTRAPSPTRPSGAFRLAPKQQGHPREEHFQPTEGRRRR